jgi:hypothetical protein
MIMNESRLHSFRACHTSRRQQKFGTLPSLHLLQIRARFSCGYAAPAARFPSPKRSMARAFGHPPQVLPATSTAGQSLSQPFLLHFRCTQCCIRSTKLKEYWYCSGVARAVPLGRISSVPLQGELNCSLAFVTDAKVCVCIQCQLSS